MTKRSLYLALFICFAFLFEIIAKDDADISKLRQTVKDTSYANYWERLDAISELGNIQNRASTEILINLLSDEEPPIREATVMALAKMRDKSLIKWFVERAFDRDQTHPKTKANAAWALRFIMADESIPYLRDAITHNDPTISMRVMETIAALTPKNDNCIELLIKQMSNSNPEVRIVAIKSLAIINPPNIFDVLVKKLNDTSPEVHAAIIEAIASTEKLDKSLSYLIKAITDPSPEVKIAALESLNKFEPAQALKSASELLNDKDWRVRASAITVLRQIRTKECLELLTNRLSKETERLRYDITCALKDIKHNLITPDDSEQTSTVAIPRFFEVPIYGVNIIFIIDFSGSMKTENKKEGKRRIDIAQEQLALALKNFTSRMKFNIIVMSTEAPRIKKRTLAPQILSATEPNKQKALEFVFDTWNKLEDIKRGRGDMYDALIEAFAEKEVDTIFLLSDGNPTYGEFIVPENILENIIEHNHYRKIMIHTILTGGKGAAERLMENIANLTNGLCIKK